MMYQFQIPGMSCSHCERAITEAVKAADPQAQVRTDLPAHRVEVHSALPRDTLVAQLKDAGYAPA